MHAQNSTPVLDMVLAPNGSYVVADQILQDMATEPEYDETHRADRWASRIAAVKAASARPV